MFAALCAMMGVMLSIGLGFLFRRGSSPPQAST
jgi:hypothetical protein